MTRLLETQHLTVQYGGLRANDDIDMSIDEGHVVGLIGPNGAGKTTFIDALTGFVPASGSIVFDGNDVSNTSPHERARRGLRRTWQSLELFDDLSVRDNLRVAAHRPSVGDIVLDLLRPRRRSVQHEVDSTLEAVGIAHLADRMPREISYGQRKLVSTARALAGDPRLICMDEPAA
ncbi:MAG: ATP-binding cassette domain-containing protein, partial [Actinomycetota bacterium]